MTISELLRKGIAKLKSAGNEAPVLEAGVILCHVLQCDKTFLYVHGDYAPDADRVKEYMELLGRRCEGVPLQYITGHQEFMSLDFQVTGDVLIPRQDTEVLVETVIGYFKGKYELKENYSILDIGTGSGCIAVSLAKYIANSSVTAVDISEGALKIARSNAVNAGVGNKVAFIKSDLFSGLSSGMRFDAIVSNPPYIRTSVIGTLSCEVREYEPVTALDGGMDGLDFYREITVQAIGFLKPGGLLAFEVGYDQAEAVSEIMQESFSGISFQKDLSGINRVVAGILKE